MSHGEPASCSSLESNMRKTLSRKNIESTVDADGSLHGKGVSRSLSNMRLSRALSMPDKSVGKGDHDVYW